MTARATYRSPLGRIAVEVTDRGVCGVLLGHGGKGRPPITALEREHLDGALAWLRGYFAGSPGPLPALDLAGSEFDRRVWAALVEIPFGGTSTYGELAARLGLPGGARAVGAANGRNPVAILVPCHRVVAAGGGLGGYGGGLPAKRWLLAHEAATQPLLRPTDPCPRPAVASGGARGAAPAPRPR